MKNNSSDPRRRECRGARRAPESANVETHGVRLNAECARRASKCVLENAERPERT
ncbi:MAG: hypothetical protein LBF89_02995 [Bacteroidales bacterium]|nr:hypothetical protein [Bacteroidales bacterium]